MPAKSYGSMETMGNGDVHQAFGVDGDLPSFIDF
jgi:hypothetical protein